MLLIIPFLIILASYVFNLVLNAASLKANNEAAAQALIPFLADQALAKIAHEEKLGKRIVILKILLFVLVVVFIICDLLYLEWSVIYIGGDDPNIVESIAGPYWIPLYIMLGDIVAIIVVIIMINLYRRRIRKAL